jgi:hypothetical protein
MKLLLIALLLAQTVEAPGQYKAGRLRSVIRQFLIESGYPNGRPGFVVDHKRPLCAGGADALPNLQFQEQRESYRKDVDERALCAHIHADIRAFELKWGVTR